MTRLDEIWKAYGDGGFSAIRSIPPDTFVEGLYLAALAFREGRFESAHAFAEAASKRRPESRVAAESAKYRHNVMRSGKPEVYATARGFYRFIRAGGNVELYENVSAALRRVYQRHDEIGLLDIGTGDGLALLPALSDNVTRIDVVEPSEKMLADLTAELDRRGVTYRSHHQTLQDFVATQPAENWDIVQATYSLHSIPPVERKPMLEWIRQHTGLVLIAEFDVPNLGAPCGPAHVQYLLERYERGLSEYRGSDRDIVAQEFLIPILFGNFDHDAGRLTFEQSMDSWTSDLESAGFVNLRRHLVAEYWWADSYLVEAAGDLSSGGDR